MRRGVRVGVDVGQVRVGLAMSDPSGVLATPVETVVRADDAAGPGGDTPAGSDVAADVEAIARVVGEHEAIEVVVGLPRSLSGEEGPAAQGVRRYALSLARRVAPVPVRLVDERMTTVDAHRSLHASGRAGRRHREVVDQAAAVIILQNALDAERAAGRAPGELVATRKPRHKGRQG